MGSSIALEACLRRCSTQIHVFFTLLDVTAVTFSRKRNATHRVNIFHFKCYNDAVQCWTVGGGWRVTTGDSSHRQWLIHSNVCCMSHHSPPAKHHCLTIQQATLGDPAFPVAAARAWNALPSSVRTSSTYLRFVLIIFIIIIIAFIVHLLQCGHGHRCITLSIKLKLVNFFSSSFGI